MGDRSRCTSMSVCVVNASPYYHMKIVRGHNAQTAFVVIVDALELGRSGDRQRNVLALCCCATLWHAGARTRWLARWMGRWRGAGWGDGILHARREGGAEVRPGAQGGVGARIPAMQGGPATPDAGHTPQPSGSGRQGMPRQLALASERMAPPSGSAQHTYSARTSVQPRPRQQSRW